MRQVLTGDALLEYLYRNGWEYTSDVSGIKSPNFFCPSCGFSVKFYQKTTINGNTMFRSACTNCGFRSAALSHSRKSKKTRTKTSVWSQRVYERDEFRCRICGSQKYLEAHHIIPVANDSSLSNDVNNGITLCRNCHKKVHEGGKHGKETD